MGIESEKAADSLTSQQKTAEETKWVEAVDQITQLTSQAVIKWSPVDASQLTISGGRISGVYEADFEGKRLRLQQIVVTSSAVPIGPRGAAALGVTGGILGGGMLAGALTVPVPRTRLVTSLRLVDTNGASLFIFPNVLGIDALMTAVKQQVSGIDSLLESLRTYAARVQ